MSNKLFEAAADILANSKKSAPGMSPEKLDGEVVDLGGPTPENSKPTDDSNKIAATKAAKSATAPKTHPSAASGKIDKFQEEELVEDDMIAEDVYEMFGDENISEEFKSKVSTIFEARVHDRVSQIQEEMDEKYASMLEDALEMVKVDLTEKVNDYLSYVVEQWIEDNEIAIERGLRTEITEEFIGGLRNLFAEHYIDVPDEKVDLVEELASKVEELEESLNEEVERGMFYKKELIEAKKNEVLYFVTEGLTDTQAEKVRTLAESVDFSTEEEYAEKLGTIVENYFPSHVKQADETQFQEQIEEDVQQHRGYVDPYVAAVTQSISKTLVK